MNSLAKPVKKTARTTTIRITPPADFGILEKQYQLVRYVLPSALVFSKEKDKYARLHNELKEHLDAPYRVYTHDYLDKERRWAVYVLYPRSEKPNEAIMLPALQFDGEVLSSREIRFGDPKLHVLIKLLQVAYFRREDNNNKTRFVGQDKCYIYAKRRSDKSDIYHVCLEIELRGDRENQQIFYVYGKARTFARDDKFDPNYIHRNIYFSLIDNRDGLLMFSQVKRSQVPHVRPLYTQRTYAGSRTTLDYHSLDEVEQSRGYLIDTFIKGFVQYLTRYGFQVEHIEREFQKFDEKPSESKLRADKLEVIYVYDLRFNRQHDLEVYMDAFQKEYPDLKFEVIEQLTSDCTIPVLVVQDCEGKAFGEGMPLTGQSDPHQQLYEQFPLVAKQFINVNNIVPEREISIADYLGYQVELLDKYQIIMTLNELFLKDLILRRRDVNTRIPLAPTDMLFVHRENRGRGERKQEYEVALRFTDGAAHFLNLRIGEDLNEFDNLVDGLGVDWDAGYEQILAHHKVTEPNEELNSYDVIIGPGMFSEIDDAQESLLYEYDKIISRLEEAQRPLDLDDLKLAHRYNELVDDISLSEDFLIMRGFIQKPPLHRPKTRSQKEALELYRALHQYDDFLEGLKTRYHSISFRELTTNEGLKTRISELFESTGKLHNLYKKIRRFEGVREAEVIPVYQGIWYTEDLRYVVGDVYSMNATQARAHRVRRFVVYQGAEFFDIQAMLETMSVKFVRLNQYTVYPYYFHLIDLYIDNVLQHQERNSLVRQSKPARSDSSHE